MAHAPVLTHRALRTLNHAKPQQVRFCCGRFAASWYNNLKAAACAAARVHGTRPCAGAQGFENIEPCKVTILSGFPDFEYAQRAIGLGVVRYVLKPSKMHELEEALAVMVENLGGAPASGAVQSAENAQNFIIKKAVQYIEQHYAEKLTLPDVADKVYVSQWHLSKLIAKNTGQSFSDLLNGVRIAKAKELLADPALKVWEVSDAVGFCGCDAFFPHFQKMENMSANEYRNKQIAR